MAKEILLRVRDLHLTVAQTGQQVLQGMTFDLQRGEVLGLVGESGSGKTLTALAALGLLPPEIKREAGSIFFEKERLDLASASPKVLQSVRGGKIAMVFQDPGAALNPVLTCGDQISEVLRQHRSWSRKQARKVALDWMGRVGLSDLQRMYRSYPHQLSGGQQQRVVLAMALCCDPDILIADEPTTGLDVTVQRRIIDLLKDLQRERRQSMIFISHDLNVVASLADRVLIMRDGRILEEGSCREVFLHPESDYTRALINCRPALAYTYHRLPTLEAPDQPRLALSDRQEKFREEGAPLIRAEDLHLSYFRADGLFRREEIKAVRAVSFSLFRGQTLGLVGESGSGKSTLGQAIVRLKELRSGNLFLDEKNYRAIPADPAFFRRVQMIFQDPYLALNPRRTIGYAILEPLLVHRLVDNREAGRERVVELLDMVGLSAEDYRKYPHQFSGGQRQRICIARALAMQPEVIICDEIVSALDVSVQARILNLLKDLQEQFGFSYVFISHDLSVVQFMSDRILVMRAGEIVERGTRKQIFQNPAHPYTRALLEAVPSPPQN